MQKKKQRKNNRLGKTRDLFKKIRDTKRPFHAKMGTIKDRNSMDLTEVEDNRLASRLHMAVQAKTTQLSPS